MADLADLVAGLRAAGLRLKAELQPSRAQTAQARQMLAQTRERARRVYAGARRRRKQAGDVSPEYDDLEAQVKAEIAQLMARLRAGSLTPAEWEAQMQVTLATYHQAAAMAGLKDAGIEPDELTDALAEQYAYLKGFRQTVAEFSGDEAPWGAWEARAAMYGDAIGASFWRSYAGGWPLPAYPRDGTTQCLTHCRCEWRIDVLDQEAGDADAYWELSPVEHCQTCIERAAQWAPLRIRGGVLQE